MADMVLADDSDDEQVQLPAAKIKKGKVKFDTSDTDENGNWRPRGELRKKKQGKGWKVRYCTIVSFCK